MVVVFVHKATTFRNFFHHVTTTDVLCTGDCQFYLLCVILDIYRSPTYVYCGLELVSVTRASMWNLYLYSRSYIFQSCNFQSRIFSPTFSVLHFPPLHFGPAFSSPAFSGPAFFAPRIVRIMLHTSAGLSSTLRGYAARATSIMVS